MDDISNYYQNANVSDIDPDPWSRMVQVQRQTATFNRSVSIAKESKQNLEFERNKLMAIRPHAELTMLEAKKYEKAAWSQDSEAEILASDINDVRGVADSLVIDIQGKYQNVLNLLTYLDTLKVSTTYQTKIEYIYFKSNVFFFV